jgi:hypothetical protein
MCMSDPLGADQDQQGVPGVQIVAEHIPYACTFRAHNRPERRGQSVVLTCVLAQEERP